MTGHNYSLLLFCSLRNLSPLSSLAINISTLWNSRVKQQPPLHTKVLLAPSSQDSLLVFRKTGGIVMEGEEFFDFAVVLVRDTDCKCRATSIDFTTSRSALQLFTTIATHACVREDIIHWRGHYSLVK